MSFLQYRHHDHGDLAIPVVYYYVQRLIDRVLIMKDTPLIEISLYRIIQTMTTINGIYNSKRRAHVHADLRLLLVFGRFRFSFGGLSRDLIGKLLQFGHKEAIYVVRVRIESSR